MSEEEQELIKNCKRWIDEEDINYTRWFGLNELAVLINLIEKKQKEIENSISKDKIRDKIKELEEDKQTILQAIEEAKESKDEDFLKYNREILYRINGEISVLKEILGE